MLCFGVTRYVPKWAYVCAFRPLTPILTQVEYLVVAVDEEAKKARLSLAQAEILKSLAKDEALWKSGDSPRPENKEQWVSFDKDSKVVSNVCTARVRSHLISTPSSGVSCWKQRRDGHGGLVLRIFSR